MAISSFNLLLYIGAAYISYAWLRSYLSARRFQRFALENGCEPPHESTIAKLPWGIDRIYRLVRAGAAGEDVLDMLTSRYRDEPDTVIATALFGQRILDTDEPAVIQAFLATKFKDFEIGQRRHAQFGTLLGHNIFTSDGAFWEHSRALFRPQFVRDQINDLESTERAVQAIFQVLPPVQEDGWTGETDLMELFYRFTLDTATEFLFGFSVNSQLAAASGASKTTAAGDKLAHYVSDKDVRFTEAFQTAQLWLAYRIRMQSLYWLANSRALRDSVRIVRQFVEQLVREALDPVAREEKKKTAMGKGDREKYVLLEAVAEDTQDPVELRDQMLGILLAGRDTTAALLSWIFVVLVQNPAVFQKLRRAILEDFGSNPNTINFASLKSCRYLQYVLNETLRLYPSVPFNNRVCLRDTVLPVGGGPRGDKPVAVQKGTVVSWSVYAMHRRKDLWGEDAEVFRPERWEGRKSGWDFLPFNGGPRICLGQQYALTEAGYCVVRMLQRFDGIEGVGMERVRKGLGLTLFPRDGVHVRLHKAQEM